MSKDRMEVRKEFFGDVDNGETIRVSGKFAGDRIHPFTGEVLYSREDHARKMFERFMTADGKEIPDPRPAKPIIKGERRMSMFDHMKGLVAAEIARREAAEEQETPEDAADMGDEDEELIEHLSEYERADLESTLAQAEKVISDRKKAAAKSVPAEGGDGSPGAAPGEGRQGAKPAEGGGDQPPLTPTPGAANS